ncbi:MAG: hypothetical protein LBS56_10195, partial [Propionibacteriaceae bacterium]|nr:hypothetical protein [Propionibacteriaceae bacterium]
MPEARPPRDDDELFSQIVEREFHEKVAPTRPPRDAATPPAPPPPPAPFELNLFDDDESYRDAPRLDGMTRLTGLARV